MLITTTAKGQGLERDTYQKAENGCVFYWQAMPTISALAEGPNLYRLKRQAVPAVYCTNQAETLVCRGFRVGKPGTLI